MKDSTQMQDFPLTLTVKDLGSILGISRISAYNLCHAEGFPSIRVGKRILIPRDSLIRWIEMQAGKTA